MVLDKSEGPVKAYACSRGEAPASFYLCSAAREHRDRVEPVLTGHGTLICGHCSDCSYRGSAAEGGNVSLLRMLERACGPPSRDGYPPMAACNTVSGVHSLMERAGERFPRRITARRTQEPDNSGRCELTMSTAFPQPAQPPLSS